MTSKTVHNVAKRADDQTLCNCSLMYQSTNNCNENLRSILHAILSGIWHTRLVVLSNRDCHSAF